MSALPLILPIVSEIFDRIIPDPDARDKAKAELLKAETEAKFKELEIIIRSDIAQTQINAEEAKSDNLFVAGWRPAAGWVCVTALGYHYVMQPLLAFVIINTGHTLTLPVFDMGTLETVLFGMLGLGSFRTMEKVPEVLPWLRNKK